MEVPKGYVAVLPEAIEMRIHQNGALLRFQAMENMGKIIVSFTLTIDKQVYLPEEYRELKAFLQMLDKVYREVIAFEAKK